MIRVLCLMLLLLATRVLAGEVNEDQNADVRLWFAATNNTPQLPGPFTFTVHDKTCGRLQYSSTVPDPAAAPCDPPEAGCVAVQVPKASLTLFGSCKNAPNRCCAVDGDCPGALAHSCLATDDERVYIKLMTLTLPDGPAQVPINVRNVRFYP